MSNPFFLASGPVGILEQAIQVTLLHGGEYSAGDAQDKLNKDILDPNNKDVGNWHAALFLNRVCEYIPFSKPCV